MGYEKKKEREVGIERKIMDSVLAVKLNANPTNPKLGYVKAILCKVGGVWAEANKSTVPKASEVFIYGDYENDLDRKFDSGVIINLPVEEVEDRDASKCEYAARSDSADFARNYADLITIFEIGGSIHPERKIELKSPIKPMGAVFFSVIGETASRELFGPFEINSAQYDYIQDIWQLIFQPASNSILTAYKIEPYSMLKINVDAVPNDVLFKIREFRTNEGALYLGVDLINNIKIVGAETLSFIDNKTLVSLIESSLNPNSKLGRKGRKSFLAEIEANKSLKPVIKNKAAELLKEQVELRDDLIKTLIEAGDTTDPHQERFSEQNKSDLDQLRIENTRLKEEASQSSNAYNKLEAELSEAIEKVEALESENSQQVIHKLKEENEKLKKSESASKDLQEVLLRIKLADEEKIKISGEVEALKQTAIQLKAEVMQDNRKFRDKALEVLPFLDVFNTSLEDEGDAQKFFKLNDDSFFEVNDDILDELCDRVLKQGYVSNPQFLNLAIASSLTSRFVGFFGEPGTGKTTLANCISNAFGTIENSAAFINVGKGWNSHNDFIGYANTFIEKFKFQNEFFRQFEYIQVESDYYPMRTVILDEASLSPIDSYLSDFMSLPPAFQDNRPYKIPMSGKDFYFPSDFRFLLTFNFDENTETLPKKIIDRMPIIHCSEVTNGAQAIMDYELYFSPISPKSLDDYLSEKFKRINFDNMTLWEKVEDFLDLWSELPGYSINPRKRMQIETFFKVIENGNDLDEGVLLDYIGQSYLLPLINGEGEKFENQLLKLSKSVTGLSLKISLEKLIENGARLQIYRYI